MALVFVDSFDHYSTLGDKGWGNLGNASIVGGGRFGNCLRCTQQGNADWNMPSALTTGIVGFSFMCDQAPSANATFFGFIDVAGGVVHVTLELSTTRFIRVTRNGTLLATGTIQIPLNVWCYIECKVTIDDSTGAVQLKVNETLDVNISGVDTRNGGNASFDTIRPWTTGFTSGTHNFFDDLYIVNTSGGSPTNDFLGDIRVEALYPNGNGNTSNLTGSDGNSTDNYLLVDETSPNGDTDYVESSNVGDKDTYAFGNLTPTSGTIYGVQINQYAKKTDAGTRKIASVARLSGTEVDSADETLSTSYQYLRDIRETKPGGGAWSVSDVNSAEFGPKITA